MELTVREISRNAARKVRGGFMLGPSGVAFAKSYSGLDSA
jgi:hypothetical protein